MLRHLKDNLFMDSKGRKVAYILNDGNPTTVCTRCCLFSKPNEPTNPDCVNDCIHSVVNSELKLVTFSMRFVVVKS